jgi:tRNA(Ile)-lysidine synthase
MKNKKGPSSDSAEGKVLRFIQEHNLFSDAAMVVVAVSGGPDSVCLLHIMASLQNELDINVQAAHLNHKLREEESDGDAKYVSDLCHNMGIPCTIEERNVQEYRQQYGGTLEEAAREVRYQFLAETAENLGTNCVVTGHTKDDNVETILLHIVRGTGTRGLRGLLPETALGKIRVVRPLLGLTREETVGYCREHDLQPRQDSSNLSLSPLRNRIRQQLIPLMETYNESVGDALLRLTASASDELDYLDSVVDDIKDNIVIEQGNSLSIDKKSFLSVHPALKRHLLRDSVYRIAGTLKDIETRHIEYMLELTENQPGKMIHLPEGLTFAVDYDRFVLTSDPNLEATLPAIPDEYKLNVPGQTEIPGWNIIAEIIDSSGSSQEHDAFTASFDLQKTGDELIVRSRKPADRFQPLGMSHDKKVGEFMINEKIPQASRERVPVVCSPDQIIWVAGYRIDNRVRITPDTDKVLKLRFQKTV